VAKKLYLKDLLGELSLDRALLQILDQPYLKDVAARLKGSDAVQSIMEKLDKDENIFGWMDYDQLMDMRSNILPDMLIKYSELEQPKFSETPIGETFDEQFKNVFSEDLPDDLPKPLPKETPTEELFPEKGEMFQVYNQVPMVKGDDIHWVPAGRGLLSGEPDLKSTYESGEFDMPSIQEIRRLLDEGYRPAVDPSHGSEKGLELRKLIGEGEYIKGSGRQLDTFDEETTERILKNIKLIKDHEFAKGGIAALKHGGKHGELEDLINEEGELVVPIAKHIAPEYFGDIANPIWVQGRWWDFDQLDEEQKKYWKEADRLKHGKDYGGDYIPFPDRYYWNPETGGYQELPFTEEQWADEPHILKQRREHKEVPPFGYDKAKTWKELGKQLVPDELAWWESYLKGNVPGVHGVVTPGTYETVFGPMEDYYKNVEEWRAQTGRPERWYTEMGAGLGLGLPVGWASAYGIGALLRKFGNPKIAKIIAEAFPLTMSKKGPFSLANWKKSLIRNPWELAKLHWTDWRKGAPGQLLKTIAPKAATRLGTSVLGGPIGLGAAGALTVWDLYRLIKGGVDSSIEEDTIELMAEEMQ